MSSNDPLAGAGLAGAQLVLQAVYLKDCSFESPQARGAVRVEPADLPRLNTAVEPLGGELREVILTVTVSAKQGDRTMFLVEVKQAGAFLMQNLATMITREPPGLYARDSVPIRARRGLAHGQPGRLPAAAVAAVNFEALFNSAASQQQPPSTTTN